MIADDAGVSGTDAALTAPLVIVCAERPGLEPPLERTDPLARPPA